VQLQAILAPRLARAGGTRLKQTGWIALFVLGLCFWVPALLKAKVGASATTDSSALDARTSPTSGSPAQTVEGPATIPSPSLAASCRATVVPTSRLVVTTTILGRSRRAAIVNGRLYREGDKIIAGSDLYRLAGVSEDRIDLVALGPGSGAKRSVMLQPARTSDRDPPGSH
jgi:hypothetical protein